MLCYEHDYRSYTYRIIEYYNKRINFTRTKIKKIWYRKKMASSAQDLQKHSTCSFSTLPLEVLEEIFLSVPEHKLVLVCRLVCHKWKEVIDSQPLWRKRCRKDGHQLGDHINPHTDWRLFYFLCKKRRNLIKNPTGHENFSDWTILNDGGDKWKIMEMKVELSDNTYSAVQNVFVTSYALCRKSQLIDLKKEGYTSTFMDQFQPHIKICDWHAPTWQISSQYQLFVELLDKKKRQIQRFTPPIIYYERGNDIKTFEQITYVFRDYGPGVRYIHFVHGGKDTIYWAGWWGVRVTNSSIEIVPSPIDT